MFQWPDSYLPRLWLQCKEAKSLDTAGQKHLWNSHWPDLSHRPILKARGLERGTVSPKLLGMGPPQTRSALFSEGRGK